MQVPLCGKLLNQLHNVRISLWIVIHLVNVLEVHLQYCRDLPHRESPAVLQKLNLFYHLEVWFAAALLLYWFWHRLDDNILTNEIQGIVCYSTCLENIGPTVLSKELPDRLHHLHASE